MARTRGNGFSLIEVLVGAALVGAGLAGMGRLAVACVREEGHARRHMAARALARATLEAGRAEPGAAPFQVLLARKPEGVEVRVAWAEAQGKGARESMVLFHGVDPPHVLP